MTSAPDDTGLRPRRADLFVGRAHDVLQRVHHELEPRGQRAGDPLRVFGARGIGAQVHDHREQVRPRDPVDQRVMRLGQHGPALVLEPFDHPDLPEGLRAVELLCHDAPDELAQLALASRRGQRSVAQVVLDVEVRVVHPDRPPQLEGDEPDLLAVARDEVELGVDHGHDVGERRRGPLEDGDRGDVHVGHVVSMWRNDASRGLNRSGLIDPPFRAVSGPNATTAVVDLPGQPALAATVRSPSEARSGVSWISPRVSS